jgi:GT2 family glycosyltransferase
VSESTGSGARSRTRSDERGGPARTGVLLAAVVLYEQSLADVWRAFRPLVRALELAGKAGQLTDSSISIGDCSPEPVLDDEAADDLRRHAAARGVGFGYRWFNANLGHSGGSDELVAGARADVLLFVNPDTYCAPTAVGQLLTALADPWVVAADARQIPCEHPKEFHPITGEQAWASGCFLMVRRTAFEEVGGFDRAFFTYGNDVDLSWRLRLRGGKIRHVPRAAVFHDKRLTERAEVVPTRTELYQGLLARFMLAHRYGRTDVIDGLRRDLAGAELPAHRQALADFDSMATAGALPSKVRDGKKVADFRDGDYGPRRF